jgi:hypothetical protein
MKRTQLDFRHGVELRASAQPSQEMIRLVPKSRHIPRGNIQQVFRSTRAIGHASPRRTAAIDHRHLEGERAESRQIYCGHDAAEAASHNGDSFGR